MALYKTIKHTTGVKRSTTEVITDLHDFIETLDSTTAAIIASGVNYISGFGLEANFNGWLIYKGVHSSASASISPSISVSLSASASISPSKSALASISPSGSASASISPSTSISPSSSVSPSPGG